MKHFLILLLTVPFAGFAQDCPIKKEVDAFSQQPKVSTGFIPLTSAAGKASVNIEADSKEIRMLFSLGEGACFDDQSTAAFQFDGSKSKSTQRNATAMNCDGIFTIVFRNSATPSFALNKISTQKITTIVLTGNGKQKSEFTLNDTEKQLLMERASCLLSEAKKLQ